MYLCIYVFAYLRIIAVKNSVTFYKSPKLLVFEKNSIKHQEITKTL